MTSTAHERLLRAEQGTGTGGPVVTLATVLLVLIPLVPRPTFGGTVGLVAPLVGAAFVYLAVLTVGRHVPEHLATKRVLMSGCFIAVAVATMLYAARVGIRVERPETGYVISRVLLVLFIVACCCLLAGPALDVGIRRFMWGVIPLAILVGFLALTGVTFLEPVSPSRTLGATFPWFKTSGVPRSFGEQAILLSMALAYVLCYWNRLGRLFRATLLVSCIVILAAGQSRNMMLAALAVVLMWFLVVRLRARAVIRPALVAAMAATFVVQLLLPRLSDFAVVRALVGENVFQRNVSIRFTLAQEAGESIVSDWFGILFGNSHVDWFKEVGLDAGVHNFFLGELLFLGVVGGALTVWGFFIRPLGVVTRILMDRQTHDRERIRRADFAVTAGVGVLISLNFYEGFFSLILGVYIALLWQLMLGRDTATSGESDDRR